MAGGATVAACHGESASGATLAFCAMDFSTGETGLGRGDMSPAGSEKVLDLLPDDLVQVLPLVEHRGQNVDFQRRIVGFADSSNGLQELVHAFLVRDVAEVRHFRDS